MTGLEEKNFKIWKIKPVWNILTPSELVSVIGASPITIHLFGVDRSSLDISRNWEKINSVEQYNQGWAAHPTDFTITIALKTQGKAFEAFRRLGPAKQMFDINLDVLKNSGGPLGTPTYIEGTEDGFVPWMVGFETYIGCVVQREGRSVEIGGIPIQEFECTFLERRIASTKDYYGWTTTEMTEGDGIGSKVNFDDLNSNIITL